MLGADSHIRTCIDERKSFLLDAGAGSGKTFSLVEALKYLRAKHESEALRLGQQFACITYTNVAKDEVIERTANHPAIRVSTIHDFLWDAVRPHQRALKAALLEMNAGLDATSTRRVEDAALREALAAHSVEYSDRGSNFLEGRIHHDDLLSIAQRMFEASSLLCRLVGSKYPFILVDECQDAAAAVMAVLSALIDANAGHIVVGLFGDKCQNIYHSGEHRGVGEVPPGLSAKLTAIVKGDNRRCSEAVIGLLNRIRTDIQQFPAADNVPGSAVYLSIAAADADMAIARARAFVARELGWDASPPTQKILFLTHRLIARRAGYSNLLHVYDARGQARREDLLTGDDPVIAFFITKVEPLVEAWDSRRTGACLSILRAGEFDIVAAGGKAGTRASLDRLAQVSSKGTVRDVLTHLRDSRLLGLSDALTDRLKSVGLPAAVDAVPPDPNDIDEKERAFFTGLFSLQYSEIRAFHAYFSEHTPFSTKHGVKGAEFDTVFVVLDDKGANWNFYSFEKYLNGEDATRKPDRELRTRNLFYVCCSRAKRNLAVVDLGGTGKAKEARMQYLFGSDMCFVL